MKIVVGTKNQKKIDVVKNVCEKYLGDSLEVTGFDANSRVPEAPQGKETYTGASNRAKSCEASLEADYYIGIESGLVERYGNMFEEAWAVVIHNGKEYVGYSSGLVIPKLVTNRMISGQLHNEIMEQLDDELNLPKDNRDTWSRYSGGQILRSVSLEEAVRNALIQSVEVENNLLNK